MVTSTTGEASGADLPWGVRPFGTAPVAGASGRAEEAHDLWALASLGVPVAEGFVVQLAGRDAEARLRAVVERALSVAATTERVLIRPLFPTRSAAARFARRPGMGLEVSGPSDAGPVVEAFLSAARAHEVTAALGGSLDLLAARVLLAASSPSGRAASADPSTGDPDLLRVWASTAAPWVVDRRTARVLSHGEGALDGPGASRVADLADRAQLVLGRPVELDWCLWRDRVVVTGVRPLVLSPAFTAVPFRIVTLIATDEGTVSPLTVDCLDKALRPADGSIDEATVRRIYARSYRRMEGHAQMARRRSDPASLARAGTHAAAVAVDVAAPIAAVRRFERTAGDRLENLDAVDLTGLSDDALLDDLRARQRLVIEAVTLLDHLRIASLGALAALEAAVGTLPAECFPALARPRATRARRRTLERLAGLAQRIETEAGTLVPPGELSRDLRRAWDGLRPDLEAVRSLSLDVGLPAWGRDDGTLLAALRAAPWERLAGHERARSDATRRLLATARHRPLGRSREMLAVGLSALLKRISTAKGRAAEGLAAASLRLREGALEVGKRLVRDGLVDEPEDALYLHVAELGQGIAGEPGAYAARVRLRREDEQRWARFEAPRRLARSRS